jgi:hypothetical protein
MVAMIAIALLARSSNYWSPHNIASYKFSAIAIASGLLTTVVVVLYAIPINMVEEGTS